MEKCPRDGPRRPADLPDHAGESPLLSRSGGEKGLRGSGAGTLGVPLGGTRRVGAPVFLPGESQGQGSPVGCHLWGRTELDTTEAT